MLADFMDGRRDKILGLPMGFTTITIWLVVKHYLLNPSKTIWKILMEYER